MKLSSSWSLEGHCYVTESKENNFEFEDTYHPCLYCCGEVINRQLSFLQNKSVIQIYISANPVKVSIRLGLVF